MTFAPLQVKRCLFDDSQRSVIGPMIHCRTKVVIAEINDEFREAEQYFRSEWLSPEC